MDFSQGIVVGIGFYLFYGCNSSLLDARLSRKMAIAGGRGFDFSSGFAPTVVGFILLIVLGNNGPIGKLLMSFDLSIVFTWYGAVISATLVAFPLMYRTVLGAFEQIDNNLIEVARSLGASEWKIFYRVMMPLAFPGVMAGVVLSFARALGEFGATLMLAGNIPGRPKQCQWLFILL